MHVTEFHVLSIVLKLGGRYLTFIEKTPTACITSHAAPSPTQIFLKNIYIYNLFLVKHSLYLCCQCESESQSLFIKVFPLGVHEW